MLTDHQQLTDLVYRLGAWIDDKGDDARGMFTADASISTPGGTARGVDAVAAQARRNHDVDRTQHLISNVLVDLDDPAGTATVRANLVATFVPDAAHLEQHRRVGGRYDFRAVHTDDGWRFTAMQVTPIWSTEPLPAPVG